MTGKTLAHLRQQWIGVIALLLVLTGGTAYALDGSNTVFTDDIVNDEVKGADIGQGAVGTNELRNETIVPADVAPDSLTSGRIANGSLSGVDVANNSLTGADVDEDTLVGGPTNPTGPAGGDLEGTYPDPEIANRTVGANELAFLTVIDASTTVPPGGGVGSVTAACPSGTQLISGGAFFPFPSGDISASFASNFSPGAWNAQGQNNGNAEQTLLARAFCLEQAP